MPYRDDRDALMEQLTALQGQVRRVEQLEQRVRELEEDNRRLHQAARAAGQAPASAPAADTAAEVYVDDKIADYIDALLAATRSPQGSLGQAQLADYVLSGARPDDAGPVLGAARARAVEAGRRYAIPADVVRVAPGVLADRVILTDRAARDGVSGAALVERIVELVELP